jgi:hypothetical protein
MQKMIWPAPGYSRITVDYGVCYERNGRNTIVKWD